MTNRFSHIESGKIPNNWHFGELGDYVTIETGKRAKGGGLSSGIIPSIGGEHIDKSGKILWENLKFIPEHFYNELKQGRIMQNDILVVKDGATTGKVAFIKSMPYDRLAVNEHVFIIRTKTTDVLNCFLYYVMASPTVQKQIKSLFHGMIGGITREEVSSFVIPIPPLKEQQKIAEILSTVDEVIEKVDKAIEKTERLKKGLMQGLLSGRLKVVESNGQLRLKIRDAKEFGISPIGEIPKEWKVVKLEDIISACENGIWGEEPIHGDIAYPVIRSTEITHDGKIDTTNVAMRRISVEKLPKFSLQNGDILLVASSGSSHLIGRAALFHMHNNGKIYLFSNFMLRIRPKNINAKFLFYYLKSPYYHRFLKYLQQTSTGLRNLPKKEFIKFKLPNPPLFEQEKIAEVLQNIDRRLELFNSKRLKFEKIKRQLMNDLLTGKRRVKL